MSKPEGGYDNDNFQHSQSPAFTTHVRALSDSQSWVPPGQGKDRTRHKNQKRRERRRAAREAQNSKSSVDALVSKYPLASVDPMVHGKLPPGGGSLDIEPSSPAPAPKSSSPVEVVSSLENIAQRMLSRTTVGHRKRRKRSQANAMAPSSTPVFAKASDLIQPTHLNRPTERIPYPSKLPSDEFPSNMTISSIDCESWYDQQWYDEEQESEDVDESTRAYINMQRQVHASLAEEKRLEEEQVRFYQDDTHIEEQEPLRESLPRAFGRARNVEALAPELDYGTPSPQSLPVHSNASHPFFRRIESIRASIYGS